MDDSSRVKNFLEFFLISKHFKYLRLSVSGSIEVHLLVYLEKGK